MFVDIVKIHIKSGNGGNGAVSFHREKYVAAGGPDGGDGGKGGDIIFEVDDNINTLLDFRYKRKYVAKNGQDGGTKKCFGKSGEDLIIKVPRGTLIKDEQTDRIIHDMSDDTPFVALKGGKGGWGNTHFATPTRQVPRFAKSGIPGREMDVILELKLLADVGIVGFPNVGKSTLLSVVSAARPKIANYHFTTLIPNLGVVYVGEGESFVMADIPGIIEGASEGVGLGIEFLRHVERCRMLIHVVDISGMEGRDPIEDFEAINREMVCYSSELAKRPQLVVGNKADIGNTDAVQRLAAHVEKLGYPFMLISAATHKGTDELVAKVNQMLTKLPPVKVFESEPIPFEDTEETERKTEIRKEDGVYFVEGDWLIKLIGSINFDDRESLQYFQRVLRKAGVIDQLKEEGITEGDTVIIYDIEFDFIE